MWYFVFLFSLVLALMSCHKKPQVSTIDIRTNLSTDFSPEKFMFVKELNTKDKVVFFYQDNEGYTHYFNGKEDIIINKNIIDRYKKKGAVPMDFSYSYDGKHIYFSQPVRWGPKKLIFIKMEPSGKVIYTRELSNLQQVIKPASIAFDQKGSMLLTWIDETPPYIKGAYLLVKDDHFPENEQIIAFDDAAVLSVKPIYTKNGFALIYTKIKNGIGELRVRYISDGSEKLIYSGEQVSDFDIIIQEDGLWIRPYQSSDVIKLIHLNSSLEKNKEYTIKKPEEAGFFGVFDGIYLLNNEPLIFAAVIPNRSINVDSYSLPQKANIYYSYAGKNFERLVGGRPFMFTSTMPSADTDNHNALVAYTDRRTIEPSVMISVINKDGKVATRDVLLEKPWTKTGSPKVVKIGENTFRIFYPVEDKDKKVWVYRAKDVSGTNIGKFYDIPKPDEKLLIETVRKFVECRKNNDYKCIYSMLDPMYRAGVSEALHEDMMKKINANIVEYKLDKCKVLDNSVIAVCDGYIKAKLPEQIMGRHIKEQERSIEQKIQGNVWVFIEGKWYYAVDLPMVGFAVQW